MNDEYWSEQFGVTQFELDELIDYLKGKTSPTSIYEVAEAIVRSLLEREEQHRNARIYSPEQQYTKGEEIFILDKKGREYAVVIDVGPRTKISINGDAHAYSNHITIEIHDGGETKKYVSNCPEFPLRFQSAADCNNSGRSFTTPGQIVMQFNDNILNKTRNALLNDERFVNFGDRWFLRELLHSIFPDEVASICSNLRERKQISVVDVVNEHFGAPKDAHACERLIFSINCALQDDKQKRFISQLDEDGQVVWSLAPPQKEVSLSVSSDAHFHGYVKITTGLRKILDFYNISSEVTFVTWGDYEIRGHINESENRIESDEIKHWYFENRITPGQKLFIKSPDRVGQALRLYTYDEQQADEKQHDKQQSKQRILLRHEIYKVLSTENKFLHYRQIAEKIAPSTRNEIQAPSVEATLSRENHLFRQSPGARGIWGLAEWTTSSYEVDKTSLLLAITDEDLVYKTLREIGVPVTVKQIAEDLANAFVVKVADILETNFLDPNDSRLTKLADGTWALIEWVNKWKEELAQMRNRIEEVIANKDNLKKVGAKMAEIAQRFLSLKKMVLKSSGEIPSLIDAVNRANEKLAKSTSERTMQDEILKKLNITAAHLTEKRIKVLYQAKIYSVFAATCSLVAAGSAFANNYHRTPLLATLSIAFISLVCWFLLSSRKLNNDHTLESREKLATISAIAHLKGVELTLQNEAHQLKKRINKQMLEKDALGKEMLELKKQFDALKTKKKDYQQSVATVDLDELILKKGELETKLKQLARV